MVRACYHGIPTKRQRERVERIQQIGFQLMIGCLRKVEIIVPAFPTDPVVEKPCRKISKRITFEVPVEWNGESSVIGIQNEDYLNVVKVDMWNILSATREDVLNTYNSIAAEHYEYSGKPIETLDKKIYSTENYEIFYYKYKGTEAAINIYVYYLYANGERFWLSGYVFVEDKPEYDGIFKRIAESVKFQF